VNIEAGKAYKMRGGGKAVVTGCFGSNPFGGCDADFPFVGYSFDGKHRTWRKDGVFYDSHEKNFYDLVAEWREPATEERVAYLCRNEHGAWVDVFHPKAQPPLSAIGSTRVTVTEGVFA
jgi:hypothetical protein